MRAYWLVERNDLPGGPQYRRCGSGHPWTNIASEALQFARKQDAVYYIHECWARDPALKAVEHADVGPAAPAPVVPDELVGRGSIADVVAERRRQIDVEGWTPEHDDEHGRGEMAMAAATYAVSDKVGTIGRDPYYALLWPWDESWWKPKDRRRDLIRAAALLIAEIERLDRTHVEAKSHE